MRSLAISLHKQKTCRVTPFFISQFDVSTHTQQPIGTIDRFHIEWNRNLTRHKSVVRIPHLQDPRPIAHFWFFFAKNGNSRYPPNSLVSPSTSISPLRIAFQGVIQRKTGNIRTLVHLMTLKKIDSGENYQVEIVDYNHQRADNNPDNSQFVLFSDCPYTKYDRCSSKNIG